MPLLPFTRRGTANGWETLVAGLLVEIAVAAQSVGAVGPFLFGCMDLWLSSHVGPRNWLAVVLTAGGLLASLHFLGLIPWR